MQNYPTSKNGTQRTCYYRFIYIEQTETTVGEGSPAKTESSICKTDVYCYHTLKKKSDHRLLPRFYLKILSSLDAFHVLVAHNIQLIIINKNSHKRGISQKCLKERMLDK